MNYEVFRILERAEVDHIVRDLGRRTFVDGKLTARGGAQEIKHNLQARPAESEQAELENSIIAALGRNAGFQSFALPKCYVMPIFSRYEVGMKYGAHVDNSLMGGLHGVRTDLAVTIFLSPPSSYDGGELVIEASAGEEQIKLDCGEAIVYSASSIHYVAPVTRGVRLAAVVWLQSVVGDERLRAILHDLFWIMNHSEADKNSRASLLLTKSYHNLLRYAAEP
ncbi:MAG TPA: Fe2+-dependent dioxygenase [Bryobacteraceae bacterium]|jgi:PKHD-type hydroxylase|nr:Fe2+-dependent dioxygenase [Bryobacteraceae bacterium]